MRPAGKSRRPSALVTRAALPTVPHPTEVFPMLALLFVKLNEGGLIRDSIRSVASGGRNCRPMRSRHCGDGMHDCGKCWRSRGNNAMRIDW